MNDAYTQGFVEKCAEYRVDPVRLVHMVEKYAEPLALPDTQAAINVRDPYELGLHAKRTGEDYGNFATLLNTPEAALTGLGTGAVVGRTLGHPLSSLLTREGRRASYQNFLNDISATENLGHRTVTELGKQGLRGAPRVAWDAIRGAVSGTPGSGEQLGNITSRLADAGRAVRGSKELSAMKPVFSRRGKGALILAPAMAALHVAINSANNRMKYDVGRALAPDRADQVKQAARGGQVKKLIERAMYKADTEGAKARDLQLLGGFKSFNELFNPLDKAINASRYAGFPPRGSFKGEMEGTRAGELRNALKTFGKRLEYLKSLQD